MIGSKTDERFSLLLQQELQRHDILAPTRRCQAGEIIFRQGDPPDGIYVVLEGSVTVSIGAGQPAERKLATFGAIDFFGEMGVIEDDRRTATATAATDCLLLCVPGELLAELMEGSPQLAGALLREFSRRLRGFNFHHVSELREAERIAMLGKFTRSIVHDLKNPLHTIGMASEIFRSDRASVEVRRNAQQIVSQQVDRLARMLNEILRVTEGGRPEKLEPTDFASYISKTMEEIVPEFRSKGFEMEVAEAPPVVVQLNTERLTHVFLNLCNNSADFMAAGGSISIRFSRKTDGIVTEVEDTGPGIHPEIAEKLFTPFFTHGKQNGTGLGLTICKNIIEDHGGRIWTRSEPGHGAIFCFSLPTAS